MKFTVRIVVVALLATLFVAPTFAQGKRKGQQGQTSLFSPAVQKVVPGIGAIVTFSKEQRQQIATLRKEIMGSEKLVELRKKARNEGASQEDKKAARVANQVAQAELITKSNDIVGKD